MRKKSTSMAASQTTLAAIVSGPGFGPQIKDRQRVRDLAEVYTNEREVNAMLDLVLDMFPHHSLTGVEFKFLEPACGSGNFLAEILRRKLRPIRLAAIGDLQEYEHWLLRALASIYAVDICAENVAESQDRVLTVLDAHYRASTAATKPSVGFSSASRTIAHTNILCADMLTDASTLEVIDYRSAHGGCFERTWSVLDESSNARAQTDLFTPDQPVKHDALAVHYTKLAESPDPTTALLSSLDMLRSCG
jgi:hypothetical protein